MWLMFQPFGGQWVALPRLCGQEMCDYVSWGHDT